MIQLISNSLILEIWFTNCTCHEKTPKFKLHCLIYFNFDKLGLIYYSMPEEFENAALFLRLGLKFTLIRHENGAFRKRSSNLRNLKTPAFRFKSATFSFRIRLPSTRIRRIRQRIRTFLNPLSMNTLRVDGNFF